jgi:hypothetical protein
MDAPSGAKFDCSVQSEDADSDCGEDLKQWSFTPQKPLHRAYQQDPKAVEAWLKTEYPAIEQRAKQEGIEIAWGDESGLRSNAQGGRG